MKKPEIVTEEQLTAEQIKNWRTVLVMTLGPYALIMPDEQVLAMRNKFQAHMDEYEGIDK